MDTDALRWFQQVADGATVTMVSELENVSQPGVSRALARLERDVGTPLLRRSGRTLRMTQAGAAFKRHVDALLHQLDDGLAAVDHLLGPETGTVALAFQTSLGSWLVPDLVSSFRRDHPEVDFRLTQVHDELVDSVLDSQQADLVISTVQPSSSALQRTLLLDEPLRLAVPSNHPLAANPQVRLADASTERFLVLQPTLLLRRMSDALCRAAGFEPQVSFVGDDVQTLRGFVAAGLGVAIVPASGDATLGSANGAIRYLRITDADATREIGMAWSTDRRLLPSADLFREHVVHRARSGHLPAIN
ncbi:transcriptional regulator [Sanguibacter gelidistatuariae]|uniref:Transcriptional regulator n=1 Tax=Sanguibacter gelidistatuariae TaxID=1814289 RepID=A0A1G6XM56_9MICO|nr:LysR substrate-binding domain-containing protein [Sanguibacter gelidistatuariae]SDD79304.1 transcriptional regulator [Sanguibacter gelidistatuariae]